MILARISRAIRTQNWFAVFLEFIIVILGVVIGFQVTAWAADRHDRDVERRHLEGIAEDLRDDIARMGQVIGPTQVRIAAIHLVLESASEGELDKPIVFTDQTLIIPETSVLSEVEQANLLANINLTRAPFNHRNAFDTLQNSGGVELIRDDRLGLQLQAYYTSLSGFDIVQGLVRDLRMESIQRGHDAGLPIFGPATLEEIVEAAQSFPPYRATLRSNRDFAVIHESQLNAQIGEASALLAAIEAELGGIP
jgi:hypothetical protein